MTLSPKEFKTLNTPILFLVFNRPDTTAIVFEEIRKAKPSRLYVASDGSRSNRDGEQELVECVRKIATAIDWSCDVKTLFRETNLGCKYAVSSAISWFFEQEEEGIILEDDCLPNSDFFIYCQNLLDYYRNNKEIFLITGNNFQNGRWRGEESYYFSTYPHIWGWASWRRAWDCYDVEMKYWPKWKDSAKWINRFNDKIERRYWENIFESTYKGKIDTWDYQWTAAIWKNNGLTITPNINLVSNIGYGENATHTFNLNSCLSKIPTGKLQTINHPKKIIKDSIADSYIFNNVLNGKYRRFPINFFINIYRIYKKFYKVIKNAF